MWYREIFVTWNRVCAIIIFNFSTSIVLVCSGTLHIPGFLCQIERIYLWKVNLIHFPLFDSTCIYFVSCFLLHFFLILSLFCIKTMSVTFCFQTFTSIELRPPPSPIRDSPRTKGRLLLLCCSRAPCRPAGGAGAALRCLPSCLLGTSQPIVHSPTVVRRSLSQKPEPFFNPCIQVLIWHLYLSFLGDFYSSYPLGTEILVSFACF